MNLRSFLLVASVLTCSLTVSAQTPPPPPASGPTPAPVPAKAAPAKAEPKKKEDPKKKDNGKKPEEPKIDGIVINRPDGTFLGLTLVDGRFKLTFYSKQKKPQRVDVVRASARWPNLHGPGQNRAVLNPAGDGTYLMGSQFVRGPYTFKLFLTLVKTDDESGPVETYTVDFRA